ncbi:MAG: NAD(P)/FAD-dependent oxidoreductase [Lachnospiraceae bacterium]
MEPKSFAVGVRIEHPQEMINFSQYGAAHVSSLGAASYKLTHQAENGRGVYSFCMCPGGFVVNASSEKGGPAVNGMSYHARDSKNANSALIVTVTPQDFPDASYMGGVAFQRRLEQAAYRAGNSKIPLQLFGDFKEGRISTGLGEVKPCTRVHMHLPINRCFPKEPLTEALCEAIPAFDRKIHGFAREDALLLGVESRTSSPLRMVRDENGESNVRGLYPCGEGAGYAGGITSAAMDGIRAAEWNAARFCP